jgi:CheY-like chemotaxis protein
MSEPSIQTIVVIDDSRVSRMFSRQYILALHPNWIVAEADTGEQALSLLDHIQADLALIDVNMPGMGGLAAAAILRERHPAMRVCVVTANVQSSMRERTEALGIEYFEKPITQSLIADILAGTIAA